MARACARLLDIFVPRLRASALRNLQVVKMAGDHEAIVDGVFRSIGRVLLAVSRMPRMNRQNVGEWIQYEGLEHFEEAKRRGRGVLFATAHLGNWELSAFAHGLMTEAMNVVVRPLDNVLVDDFLERRRMMSGNRVIAKLDAARSILRALKRNEAVGILIDQNSAAAEGAFIDFFGVTACAGTAFVKIAHHSGAAVIPGFALWIEERQKYVLRFFAPVEMTGSVERDTQRIHRVIEGVVREYPDQWMWLHRRWKTRPPGDASLY